MDSKPYKKAEAKDIRPYRQRALQLNVTDFLILPCKGRSPNGPSFNPYNKFNKKPPRYFVWVLL